MEEPTVPASVDAPRRSACPAASLAAEMERLRRMTIEERIKAALSMRDRFAWLDPTATKAGGADAVSTRADNMSTLRKFIPCHLVPPVFHICAGGRLVLSVLAGPQINGRFGCSGASERSPWTPREMMSSVAS